jgi:hypothetical protein
MRAICIVATEKHRFEEAFGRIQELDPSIRSLALSETNRANDQTVDTDGPVFNLLLDRIMVR